MNRIVKTKLAVLVLPLAFLIAAAGCSILPESAPVQLLDPQLPSPAIANRSADWSLNIARPESDPARDSNRLLVRTGGGQLQVHANARWVAAAPELLRTQLVRYLRDARSISEVSAGAAGMNRTLALDLRRFELVETGGDRLPNRLEAEIRLEARLYDSRSAELLARELFEARSPVVSADPAGLVSGFEAVLGEIVPALADWLTD